MELKNETERINYSIGYQIGGDFQRTGVETQSRPVDPGDPGCDRACRSAATPGADERNTGGA